MLSTVIFSLETKRLGKTTNAAYISLSVRCTFNQQAALVGRITAGVAVRAHGIVELFSFHVHVHLLCLMIHLKQVSQLPNRRCTSTVPSPHKWYLSQYKWSIQSPIIEYNHTNGNACIIGGYVTYTFDNKGFLFLLLL